MRNAHFRFSPSERQAMASLRRSRTTAFHVSATSTSQPLPTSVSFARKLQLYVILVATLTPFFILGLRGLLSMALNVPSGLEFLMPVVE